LVFVNVRILTNDCAFPHHKQSVAFTWLWNTMLEEHLRELTYEGGLAGISFNLSVSGEDIRCSLASYNQGYDRFFSEAFKEIKTFKPDKTLFVSKRD